MFTPLTVKLTGTFTDGVTVVPSEVPTAALTHTWLLAPRVKVADGDALRLTLDDVTVLVPVPVPAPDVTVAATVSWPVPLNV